MVIPVGWPHGVQDLVLIEKNHAGDVSRRTVLQVAFVPLTRPREQP
jgi:protein-L-isoaspartate O-methyltransferase